MSNSAMPVVGAMLAAIALLGVTSSARAADLPPYMNVIVGTSAGNAAETATRNVLMLNTVLFDLYGDASQIFTRNILAQHPVILALFSGAGGRLLLYRPGQAPIEAPPVPIAYQLMKSVAHSTMALAQVVVPYLNSPADQAWRASMLSYRSRIQSALDGLDLTDMPAEWRATNRAILQNNLAFMDASLAKGAISFDDLAAFSVKQRPLLKLNIAWAAQTQVGHWMGVLAAWKAQLGG